MSKASRIWIFIAAFVGVLIIYFALFYSGKKRFDWTEDYKLDKDRPFGTWLMVELLKEYNGKENFEQLDSPLDRSLEKAKTPSNYVFIGEEIYLEDTNVDSLIAYVAKGNNAFIFTSSQPSLLLAKLMQSENIDTIPIWYNVVNSDSVFSSIQNKDLSRVSNFPISYLYRNSMDNYYWKYIVEKTEDSGIDYLGEFTAFNKKGIEISGYNYYKIDYEKGSFFFHTQPITFSNITLKEEKTVEYANSVFAYLNDGPILWEEFNWRFNKPNPKTWLYKPNFFNTGKGPLNFVLNNPPLKWAWYLFLSFILIFMLFNGKRRKGIIPVLPDRSNTSLEHLKRISVLYKKDEDHYVISVKMFENFLGFLQNDLRINLDQNREKIIDEIVLKRKVDKEVVQNVFDRWKYIEFSKTARTEIFIKFNEELNSFYERIKQ